jgi:hypothetical protein
MDIPDDSGGVTMKLSGVLTLALLVSLVAITVRADTTAGDARIIVGHGGESKPVGPTFLVPVDPTSGGSTSADDFKNGSATQNIIELIFTGKLNKKDTITCMADDFYFANCTVTPGKGNMVTIIFDDPLNGGIPPGGEFFVGLDDVGKKTGSWKKDGVKDLDAEAIFASVSAPEPSTLFLLLSGFAGILLARKRKSSPEINL